MESHEITILHEYPLLSKLNVPSTVVKYTCRKVKQSDNVICKLAGFRTLVDLFEIEFGNVISLHRSVASFDHFTIMNRKNIKLGESTDQEDEDSDEDE